VSPVERLAITRVEAKLPWQDAAKLGVPVLEIWKNAVAASLDENCEGTCAHDAVEVLVEHWEKDQELGIARAKERLADCVRIAVERHNRTDEYGEPLECYGLGEELRKAFGRKAKDEDEIAADAVKAAWEEAIAAGASEREAAQRCLEVARKSDKEQQIP
jgi:hypothetical protein